MHDAITDSTKHCRMAAPVADNALLLELNCIYVFMFIFITYADVEGQSWDKFVINCFGVWYNLYLAIRVLYQRRLRLGWYSTLIARYKLYHTPKQLITNIITFSAILRWLMGIICEYRVILRFSQMSLSTPLSPILTFTTSATTMPI